MKLLPIAFALYASVAAASNITDYLEQHGKKSEDEEKVMYMLDMPSLPGYESATFKLMEKKDGIKLGLSLMRVVDDHVEMRVIVDDGADGSVEECYAGAGKDPAELKQNFDAAPITPDDRAVYSDAYKKLEQMIVDEQKPKDNGLGKAMENYLIAHNCQVVDVHNGKMYTGSFPPPAGYDTLSVSYEDSTDGQRIIVDIERKATKEHSAEKRILHDDGLKMSIDTVYAGEGKSKDPAVSEAEATLALNKNAVARKNALCDEDQKIYAYILKQVKE